MNVELGATVNTDEFNGYGDLSAWRICTQQGEPLRQAVRRWQSLHQRNRERLEPSQASLLRHIPQVNDEAPSAVRGRVRLPVERGELQGSNGRANSVIGKRMLGC